MSGPCGHQQLKDRIVQSRVHSERDRFIKSISESDVIRLASSHHNDDSCEFFRPPTRGSYNICYFVQFGSTTSREAERWVVRVPLAPCLAHGGKDKLVSEIATMKLIAEKTSIPIPKVHAFAIGDGSSLLASYLILEYVDGIKLSDDHQLKRLTDEQRTRLYTSLADIYIQLRRLEFSSIGRLVHASDGFKVRPEITSIDLNMQELEGLQPSKIISSYCDDNGLLTSANNYVEMLLRIADNAFIQGRSSVVDDLGEEALYHLHVFRQYSERWIDPLLDQGPFVLVHGDLEPFNLIVNRDMHVISVLDWEWSRVVPRQFFKPPLWLTNPDTTKLAFHYMYEDYLKRFDEFLAILRFREEERYGSAMLAEEWASGKADGGFLVANALENWTDIDWFAFRYINRKWYRGSSLEDRVKAFMNVDPARHALIARKRNDGVAFTAAVQQLKAECSSSEQPNDLIDAYKPNVAFLHPLS